MTTANTIACPHCGRYNPVPSSFCQYCGKALPAPLPTGPRVVGAGEFAATAAGQKLQADELHKQSKKATGALLAVAIIQTIAGLVFVGLQHFLNNTTTAAAPLNLMVIAISEFIIAIIFWGLYFWARKMPLPAAIVGLVIYATLVVINIITTAEARASHPNATGSGIGGIGVGWLDVVIIAILARAISAGMTHRKLLQQGSESAV